MNEHQCIGPRGQHSESWVGCCPTTPSYHISQDGREVWSCGRHLDKAIKTFQANVPVAVDFGYREARARERQGEQV
jgi:hypothetical protein